jgi:hypothetical protein
MPDEMPVRKSKRKEEEEEEEEEKIRKKQKSPSKNDRLSKQPKQNHQQRMLYHQKR